jgi:hypothetical protein
MNLMKPCGPVIGLYRDCLTSYPYSAPCSLSGQNFVLCLFLSQTYYDVSDQSCCMVCIRGYLIMLPASFRTENIWIKVRNLDAVYGKNLQGEFNLSLCSRNIRLLLCITARCTSFAFSQQWLHVQTMHIYEYV